MIGSSENPIKEITKNHSWNVKKILIETQEDFRQTRKTSNKIIEVTSRGAWKENLVHRLVSKKICGKRYDHLKKPQRKFFFLKMYPCQKIYYTKVFFAKNWYLFDSILYIIIKISKSIVLVWKCKKNS